MLAIVRSCAVVGLDGIIIEVETDFNPRAAIPAFTIVGLPDSAVRESRERVRAAIKNSGLQFPNWVQNSRFLIAAPIRSEWSFLRLPFAERTRYM